MPVRRTQFVIVFLVIISYTSAARAAYIRGSVYLQSVDSMFRSVGSASWYNDLGMEDGSAVLSGEHGVSQSSPAVSYTASVQGNGTYLYILEGPTEPSACYGTSLHVIANSPVSYNHPQEGTWTGDTKCAPAPPLPPPGGGGPSGGPNPDGGPYNEDIPCFPGIDAWCSPIVINFETGDYRLTGKNAPVLFDIRGDGHPLLMGWTAADADEAFLWLDRNHNHQVTSGAELFGNFTPLQNGETAKNGFEALAEFDANHDGVIDDHDPIWPQLLLWRDLNHNGISELSEISTLDSSDATAIDLHYRWTGRHDQWGNGFRYESLISRTNRSGHGVRKQPLYDIFFVSASP
jgi:hypothetical protein